MPARVALLLILSLAVAALPADQAKFPNISGSWKINLAKSSFPREAPSDLTAQIKDTDTTLFISVTETRNGTARTNDLKFDKSGKEGVQNVGPVEVHTKLTYEGGRMLEDAVFITSNGQFTRKSVTTLSPDGKTLTKESVYSSPNGDAKERIVLERQ